MGLNLSQRFGLASLVVMVLGTLGIGYWIGQRIEDGILRGTAGTTALYVESFVAPELGELADAKSVSREHLWNISRLLHTTPLGRQIVAFKLWLPDGLVLYDTGDAVTGQTFPPEPARRAAWLGQTTSRISSLESDENVGERKLSDRLLETYSPVHLGNTDRIVAVAEFYQKVDELESDIAAARRLTWLVVAGSMLLMYLLLSLFVNRASHTIDHQRTELAAQVTRLRDLLVQNRELHERVRRGAAESVALNERFLRRISAELHDGPAQEISLALLRIDPGGGVDGEEGSPGPIYAGPGEAAAMREALRHALQEIRAISAGLSLPELDGVPLPEAIQRAVRAHERLTGTRVSVHLDEPPHEAPPVVKITAYRVIQEALNNAYRHAGGAGQEVAVRGEAGQAGD